MSWRDCAYLTRRTESSLTIEDDNAQSLLATLGLLEETKLKLDKKIQHVEANTALEAINLVSPFKVMKRATRIGGRIGRPEKAKERLMKPAPNVLFPIGEYGGKERSIFKAYNNEKRKFGNSGISVEIVKYRCSRGKELVICHIAKSMTLSPLWKGCAAAAAGSQGEICPDCGGKAYAKEQRAININELITDALKDLDIRDKQEPKGRERAIKQGQGLRGYRKRNT